MDLHNTKVIKVYYTEKFRQDNNFNCLEQILELPEVVLSSWKPNQYSSMGFTIYYRSDKDPKRILNLIREANLGVQEMEDLETGTAIDIRIEETQTTTRVFLDSDAILDHLSKMDLLEPNEGIKAFIKDLKQIQQNGKEKNQED